jgi:DNA invertase Pin-like site-specific DNA recombinase
VRFFHRANRDGWNQLVTYLSGGLLYGHEVERPADFYMRKKTYQPCLGREPSRRREEVRRMLVETDLTYRQMAEELGVGLQTVHNHVYEIYRRCRRNGLRAAAGVGPYRRPATAREIEKAARRRAVKDLLGRGFNRQAVARRMGVHVCTVYRDAQAMGFWKGGRRGRKAKAEVAAGPAAARGT